MSLIKFLRFDIKHGIIKKYHLYIVYAVLTIFAIIQFQGKLNSFGFTNYSIGDCFLYIYGGSKEYVPRVGETFEIPYLWLVNHIVILYFTLNYMYKDLSGFGQQIIYRSGGRITWWISKCLWNSLMVINFYCLGYLIIFLMSVSKAVDTLEISEHMFAMVDFGDKLVDLQVVNLNIEIILLPVLFSMAISMFQMTLTLLFKPILSYILSTAVCIASAYKLTPVLFGNYSMAVRNSKVVTNGVSSFTGIVELVVIILLSVVIGVIVIRKCNILNKE